MPMVGQEDINEVFKQKELQDSLKAVKKSNVEFGINEKRAFKFGVVSATSLVDDFIDGYGAVYDEYNFEDDDIHLITRNIDKKLMEAV